MKNIILYSAIMLIGSLSSCSEEVKYGFYEYVNESDYSIVIIGYYEEKEGHAKRLPDKGDSWQSSTFETSGTGWNHLSCILSVGTVYCLYRHHLDSLSITFDHEKVLVTKYDENGPKIWPDKYYASLLLNRRNYEGLATNGNTEVRRYTFTNEDYNHAEPIETVMEE